MPKLTAEQLKIAFGNNPDGVAHALGESLREFGYPITNDWVKEEITSQLKGEKPRGLGPALFIQGWLKDGFDELDE